MPKLLRRILNSHEESGKWAWLMSVLMVGLVSEIPWWS